MGTLYELNREFLACIELENGDVINTETGEVLSYEQLDALVMERDKKIESIACQIKNLNADAEAIKAEMEALMVRRKRAERKAEWLRNYLTENLNGEKFSTAKCAVSFRKSEAVEILDRERCMNWAVAVCPEALTIKEPEINKTVVKKALKEGKEFPGVMLVERQNIQIK